MALVKVMCLGDSLTAGDELNPSSFRTYRGRLAQLLQQGGYEFDFIGSQSLTPAIGGDPNHEGYGGAGIDTTIGGVLSISARLSTIFSGGSIPDVIVLLLGWNDVFNAPTNIATRYETLVDTIETYAPSAKLLLCTLPPARGLTETQTNSAYSAYQSLNTKIRTLAAASGSDGRYLADLAARSSETDLTLWVQGIIDDVKLQPDGWDGSGITLAGGARIPDGYGGIKAASYAGMLAANNEWSATPPNPGNGASGVTKAPQSDGPGHPGFINNIAAVVPWFWTFAVPGHASSNTGVEVRNMFAAIKRASTGVWVFLFSGARGLGTAWVGGDNQGSPQGTQRFQPDGLTSFLKPAGNTGYEIWARNTSPSRGITDFFGAFNKELLHDAACIIVGMQARLALDNPSGTNDTGLAGIVAACGFDVYADRGGAHYDWLGFPRNMQDGGKGRWKRLVSTQWTWVTTVTADCHWNEQSIPPPWGFWSGVWPYNAAPTYAITEAALRASPPPIPPYAEPTGAVGAGYATGDYWDVIHLLQSGADKAAQVMYDAIVSQDVFSAGGVVTPPGGSILARPSTADWALRATSGRANWRSVTASYTPPTITTGTLPASYEDVAYSAPVVASGSTPLAWSATGLPAGRSIDATTGLITGAATTPGVYSVTVTVTNPSGVPASKAFTMVVTATGVDPTPVAITTDELLPAATRNEAYAIGLQADGDGPFEWYASSEILDGFEVLIDGTLRGVPREIGVFTFTVTVYGPSSSDAREFTLIVGGLADQWVRVARGADVWIRIPQGS